MSVLGDMHQKREKKRVSEANSCSGCGEVRGREGVGMLVWSFESEGIW